MRVTYKELDSIDYEELAIYDGEFAIIARLERGRLLVQTVTDILYEEEDIDTTSLTSSYEYKKIWGGGYFITANLHGVNLHIYVDKAWSKKVMIQRKYTEKGIWKTVYEGDPKKEA